MARLAKVRCRQIISPHQPAIPSEVPWQLEEWFWGLRPSDLSSYNSNTHTHKDTLTQANGVCLCFGNPLWLEEHRSHIWGSPDFDTHPHKPAKKEAANKIPRPTSEAKENPLVGGYFKANLYPKRVGGGGAQAKNRTKFCDIHKEGVCGRLPLHGQ